MHEEPDAKVNEDGNDTDGNDGSDGRDD